MSHDKHRNDQPTRYLRGPRGLPGTGMGVHLVGKGDFPCNCGGCKDGKRIPQAAKVLS